MNIIFDLDGTLIDSSDGIYIAYREAIKTHIQPIKKKDFIKHIGPPIQKIIPKIHKNISNEELITTQKDFRELYDKQHFLNFKSYENICDQIKVLSNLYKCYILTNKPSKPSREIIKNLNLEKYFSEIIGVDFFEKRGATKGENLFALIKNYSIDARDSIYIGDTFSDYLASKENKVFFIPFIRGYYQWSSKELKKFKFYFKNTSDLTSELNKYINSYRNMN